jgi:hypothetical protein
MPGDDPKEARQRALTFLRLAETSAYPPARERYAKLAYTWLRLATELENGRKRAVRQTRQHMAKARGRAREWSGPA